MHLRSRIQIVIVLFFAVLLSCCNGRPAAKETHKPHCQKVASLPVKYSKGFTVDYYKGFKIVTVKDVRNEGNPIAQYVLVERGKKQPVDYPTAVLIDTPVRKVVCVSTTHMAELDELDLLNHLCGITNVDLVYNQKIRSRVKEDFIADLGKDDMNYEKLISLNPDFVFTSGSWDGGNKLVNKLNQLDIKSVVNLDYMEQDPLARAEWLKFVAVFFDKEYEADSIFSTIEKKYLALKKLTAKVESRPTVFANLPFKEIWYMPSGETYMARLFRDAGAHFLWDSVYSTNGLNLNLDYEAVYAKAFDASYWINTGFAGSLNAIAEADKKNRNFRAYKLKKVYNNDFRNTAYGGFDYWESGSVHPERVLGDLVFIFHPDLLPEHQLFYYRKLQ